MATGARVLLAASAASAVVAGLLAVPVQAAAPEAAVPSVLEAHAAPAVAAAARPAAVPVRPSARARFNWSWMHGSRATSVRFAQSEWEDRTDEMGIVVRVIPRRVRAKVVLQFQQGSSWEVEAKAWTRRGRALLPVSPLCDGGTIWCQGRWPYRILVNGRVLVTLNVRFVATTPAPTPTPAPTQTPTPTPAPTQTPAPAASPTRVGTGNLVLNPGAEDGPAGGLTEAVEIPSWTRLPGDRETVYTYDPPMGLRALSPTSPGPSDRGNHYFAGGYHDSDSTLSQVIPLQGYAEAIDAGGVLFEFSAWLGGWEGQRDWASAQVEFLDFNGNMLQIAQNGPAYEYDRNYITSLLYYRQLDGVAVPRGARSARVDLRFYQTDLGDYNDGYADNIFFQLLL